MDNVTHSLIGVLLARAALPWVGSLRGALWAAILASNAPDLDLVLTPFFEDPRLGYLVHHRGHTHTLLAAIPLALGAAAFARWRDREARLGGLVGLSLVGTLLHVGADSWNNYGVHPFWPFESSWYYGDAVFILEPLLWMALVPLAFLMASGRGRAAVGVLGLALAGVTGFGLGPAAGLAWGAATAVLTAFQRRRGCDAGGSVRGVAVAGSAGLVVATLLAFGAGTRLAEGRLRGVIAAARPAEEVLDVALTPRAGTPWCWQAIVLSRDAARYHARTAFVSLAPGITAPPACELRRGEGRTAPMVAADLPDGDDVAWRERFEAPVDELARLAAASCRVDAFLHFGRAPFWVTEGERVIVGDLRYDFEPELGFAEIEVGAGSEGCGNQPSWRSEVARRLLAVPVEARR